MRTTWQSGRRESSVFGRAVRACWLALIACGLAAAQALPGAANRVQQIPPIRLGTSGINVNDICSAGTLGSLVIRSSPYYAFILSNNHVMARENAARPGEYIIQRATRDTVPACSGTGVIRVAQLSLFRSLKFDGSDNLIDAAIAGIIPGKVTPTGSILAIGPVSNITVLPALGLAVKKSGRTTGLTRGSITAVDTTMTVTYGNGLSAKFVHQMVITAAAGAPIFCNAGDSGSLVVRDIATRPNPVGLFFAGNAITGTCLANPIRAVLGAFGVGFPIVAAAAADQTDKSAEPMPQVDQAEFELVDAIKQRYEAELMRLPEAVGVGVGLADDGSKGMVIKLLLVRKTEEALNAAPLEIDGVAVEAEEVGAISAM